MRRRVIVNGMEEGWEQLMVTRPRQPDWVLRAKAEDLFTDSHSNSEGGEKRQQKTVKNSSVSYSVQFFQKNA